MNKFSVLALVLVGALASCQNAQKPAPVEAPVEEVAKVTADVLTPEKLMAEGDSLIDHNIEIKGTITHVCKHGGKKCSIMGEDPEAFVQVMARGEIGSFAADMIGTEILVKGTVKENRITKDIIAEQEAALKEKTKDVKENKEMEKYCSHSMHNLNKMKQWMSDNSKDYYPVYYVEGTSYEVVE